MFDAIFKEYIFRKELLTNYEIATNWNNNLFSDKLMQNLKKL